MYRNRFNKSKNCIAYNCHNVFRTLCGTFHVSYSIYSSHSCLDSIIKLFLIKSVEPIEVTYPSGTKHSYPDLLPRFMKAKVDYINACIGVKLTPSEIIKYLNHMSLSAKFADEDATELLVEIPPTRADILHACDIMEDVAIAYGFNNIPKTLPSSATIGKALPINKFSDSVRKEIALAGWTEVLPLILVSYFKRSSKKILKYDFFNTLFFFLSSVHMMRILRI